jgi:hypothetical protein
VTIAVLAAALIAMHRRVKRCATVDTELTGSFFWFCGHSEVFVPWMRLYAQTVQTMWIEAASRANR